MTRAALLLCLLALTGCAGSLTQAHREGLAARRGLPLDAVGYAPSERCQELDDRRSVHRGIVAGGAVLLGASGVSSIPVEYLPPEHQGKARVAVVSTAVLAGAVVAYSEIQARAATEAWAQECQ